eukprot:11256680-Ditylum_brightwellii.AAC.1
MSKVVALMMKKCTGSYLNPYCDEDAGEHKAHLLELAVVKEAGSILLTLLFELMMSIEVLTFA